MGMANNFNVKEAMQFITAFEVTGMVNNFLPNVDAETSDAVVNLYSRAIGNLPQLIEDVIDDIMLLRRY
jgi:hypothetical protein